MMLRHARTAGVTAAAAGLAAFAWAGPALAAFGDPDLTWGSSGVATARVDQASSVGALALSGDTSGGANAFGPGISVGPNPGSVLTAALWANDGVQVNTRRRVNGPASPTAVARQADGKFLVLGEGSIARVFHNANPDELWGFFDPNGSPRGGLAQIPRPPGTTTRSAKGVAVQDDGKVVAAGSADGKVFVARLIGGGTVQQPQGGFPDRSFGDGSGTRTFQDPTALSESAAGVAADADTIYVGGDARLSDGRQGFVLYRLRKADGSLVSRTFTEVTAPEGGTPRATDLVRLPDGRLVIAGALENGTRGVSQGALVSFQKSGTVDSAFGQNGLVLDKALTTEFRYTTAFGRIFGLSRTADGYVLTAYKNAAGEIDFSWGGTGLVTGSYPSAVGKATTIAATTRSGQAKLLVGGFDGTGTESAFFAARFQLGCVNIGACTVGVQTTGSSATFTQTNTTAQSNGILVERVLRFKRVAGRRVPVTRPVGRVPFGPQRRGRIKIRWDYNVNGTRLPAGTYRITMRTLRRDKLVELARPLIVKVPPPRRRAGLKSWLLRVDCAPGGGLELDRDFFVDLHDRPGGPARAHEVRLQGGDCTTEIFQ
jgi:56kDa selenium binding protein (SBP56)/Domain of unknown function (DUF5122) beta-propeller